MKTLLTIILFSFSSYFTFPQENLTEFPNKVDGVFKIVDIKKKKKLFLICVVKNSVNYTIISYQHNKKSNYDKIVKGNEYFLKLSYSGYPANNLMNYADYKYSFYEIVLLPSEWMWCSFYIYVTKSLDGLYYIEEVNNR